MAISRAHGLCASNGSLERSQLPGGAIVKSGVPHGVRRLVEAVYETSRVLGDPIETRIVQASEDAFALARWRRLGLVDLPQVDGTMRLQVFLSHGISETGAGVSGPSWCPPQLGSAVLRTGHLPDHISRCHAEHEMHVFLPVVRAREPASSPMTAALALRLYLAAEPGLPLVALRRSIERDGGRPWIKPPETMTPVVVAAVRWIESRLEHAPHGGVALVRMAEAVGLSPWHLSRLFKHDLGFTPHRYALARRVERAWSTLLKGAVPIAHAAETSGFSSSSHFSTAFRLQTGVTPRKLLNSFRPTSSPPANRKIL